VIATGFERTASIPRRGVEGNVNEPHERASARPVETASRPASSSAKDFQPRAFNTEDLDIPTFLRNRTR
jgi:hypothetical protein